MYESRYGIGVRRANERAERGGDSAVGEMEGENIHYAILSVRSVHCNKVIGALVYSQM